ncbi:uncharacterized protein LOC105389402 isoform X2 [Plutella xylostella]|uniref:uncharacterized protein LOC105389402 isoform X2 n=1 Tax=Plutella xylostella TaxID=51655 RepID=UPI002032E01C|nr:uncharacterized protein LOC105389402 isoform X2 [Plutella xylostella]
MKLKKLKVDQELDPAIPQAEIIEADQYKRSYFGPDIPTLELECWEEELSEAQLQAYKNADEEYKSIQNKLDDIVKETGGEIVYNGDQFTAYQLLGKQPVLKDLEKQSADIIRSRSRSLSISKESSSGKGKRGRPRKNREEDRDYSPSPPPSPDARHKKKHKKDKHKERDTKTKDKTLAPSNVHSVVTNVRPSEASAIGGLSTGNTAKTTAIVDLTKEDGNKNVADSREVSFNKLQGKTFPSLVVVARPYLRAKDAAAPSDRPALDSKVKSVLMHTPTKFTEWLIQQGLVRSEQWCVIHPGNKLKLGMYSDVSKFPYSGGYVWISECCPTRFVSVFCSSIFEGATHPPSVLLKLVYHWACQTNVQNVVQWVKVDNLYVKALFTWLRAVCTSAIHQHLGQLGGPGKKVEVGVISLGTTSHDGTQRQVKVEVLGVLDPVEKLIRLRAVEPLSEHEKNYKKRFQKILEPLINWVHPGSTILTDLTVDKGTLISMGFKTVHQSSSQSEHPSKHSNANIMEYLRRIVPRMFQNTLSLLSRQIIQQFLDELVWREKFGVSPGLAFDNVVTHIAEQTRLEARDPITVRLNRIAHNPFKNWKYCSKKTKGERDPSPVVEEPAPRKRGRKKKEPSPPPKKKQKKPSAIVEIPEDDEEIPLALRRTKIKQEKKDGEPRARRKRERTYVDDDHDELDDIPLKNIKKEVKQEETVSMERFYFGQTGGSKEYPRVAIAVECPLCRTEINNNCDLLRHIFSHLSPSSEGSESTVCIYCATQFNDEEALKEHLKSSHPSDTKSPDVFTYACLICEVRFAAVLTLASHMQKTHAPLELPYCCGACDYRSSAQRHTVDHFYKAHSNDTGLQCPHCLKVIVVYGEGMDLGANVRIFIDHIKAHKEKQLEVRCNRCALKFVHLGQLKEHQIRDHATVAGATPLCVEEHLITKPRNKPRPPVKDTASHSMSDTYEDVTLVLPENMLCRECDTPLDTDKHFLGTSSCSKCPYVTSCYRAMLQHSSYCAGPHSLEDAPRPAPRASHCVCGHSTSVGTDMLTHLLLCGHLTAYPSEAAARENTVQERPRDEAAEPEAAAEQQSESVPPLSDYAPPSVLNTQLSLDDLAPPSVLQPDQNEQELLKDAYERPLATPRHEDAAYSLADFEPLPQEPPPQPDFEQL